MNYFLPISIPSAVLPGYIFVQFLFGAIMWPCCILLNKCTVPHHRWMKVSWKLQFAKLFGDPLPENCYSNIRHYYFKKRY